MNDFVTALQAVRDVYVNFPRRYELNQEELKKVELEIQDILHVLELSTFNASDGYKYAKELQRLRHARRALKDELEMLETVKEFVAFPKPTEKNINRVIGDIRNTENRHGNRVYSMRIRYDLQEKVKK